MSYPRWLENTAWIAGERCTDGISAKDATFLILALLREAHLSGLSEGKQIADNHAFFYNANYKPGGYSTAFEIAKAIEMKLSQCREAPWPPEEKEPALAEEGGSNA